jgi:restriction system protein
MARRKQSAFEDFIELAALMPWWAGVLLAIVAYLVIHPFAIAPLPDATAPGELGHAVVSQLYRTIAAIGQYIIPAALLIGAVISVVGRVKRERLLEATAAVASPNAAKSLSWREFEMLVGEVFRGKGYSVQETAPGADGGVDLELQKDGELYLVQCKHWRGRGSGIARLI